MSLLEQKEYKELQTPEWMRIMGKNVAVALWFEEQINNGKETLK